MADEKKAKAKARLNTKLQKVWEVVEESGVMESIDEIKGLRKHFYTWKAEQEKISALQAQVVSQHDQVVSQHEELLKMEKESRNLAEQERMDKLCAGAL